LLLFAVDGDALVVTAAEFLGRHVVENLAVAGRKRPVPRGGAAPRDDEQPLRIDVEPLREPGQERNPVEHFEPDLAEPRTDHDRVRAGGEPSQVAFETPRPQARALRADAAPGGTRDQPAND